MVKWTCELHLTEGLRGRQLRLNPLTTLQRSTDLLLQVRKEQFRGLKPPTLEGPQDSVATVDLVVRQPRFGLGFNIDWASPVAQTVKKSACNAGDQGSVPGWGRSPGEGNGNPLQYSCLENSIDRGAWRATVHRIAKSQDTTERLTLHFQHLLGSFGQVSSLSGHQFSHL